MGRAASGLFSSLLKLHVADWHSSRDKSGGDSGTRPWTYAIQRACWLAGQAGQAGEGDGRLTGASVCALARDASEASGLFALPLRSSANLTTVALPWPCRGLAFPHTPAHHPTQAVHSPCAAVPQDALEFVDQAHAARVSGREPSMHNMCGEQDASAPRAPSPHFSPSFILSCVSSGLGQHFRLRPMHPASPCALHR
jgi:hypothetical protein